MWTVVESRPEIEEAGFFFDEVKRDGYYYAALYTYERVWAYIPLWQFVHGGWQTAQHPGGKLYEKDLEQELERHYRCRMA